MSIRRKKERATVCVIWERTQIGGRDVLEIKHRHLCGSHANIMANGAARGDKWTERTLAECATNGGADA